jgi:hypothetical protein
MWAIRAWHRSSVTLCSVTVDLAMVLLDGVKQHGRSAKIIVAAHLPCADDMHNFRQAGLLPIAVEQYIVRCGNRFARVALTSGLVQVGTSAGRRSVFRSVFSRLWPRTILIEWSACEAFPRPPIP